jgi:hypothetical protein
VEAPKYLYNTLLQQTACITATGTLWCDLSGASNYGRNEDNIQVLVYV